MFEIWQHIKLVYYLLDIHERQLVLDQANCVA